MNEEFAISLKTVFDQTSFNQIKKQLSDFKKEFEKGIEVAVKPAKKAERSIKPSIPSFMDTSNPELQEMEERLARIKEEMLAIQMSQKSNTNGKGHIISDEEWARFDQLEAEAIELEDKIAQSKNEMAQTTEYAAELSSKAEEAEISFTAMSQTIVVVKNDLRKTAKQIGRMLLSLVGVRGVYGSIRKAMSAYLAQNQELQNKLNGAWYALGSLFAPVLEWVINKFVYLVSLVDALVKSHGCAGVNMANYGKKAGSAAKKQKQLLGIDEINNINSQSGGGAGGMKLDPISDKELKRFKALLALVAGIAAGLAAWKIAKNLFKLPMKEAIGIGLAVAGATMFVLAFVDAWTNGINWDNLRVMLLGIGLAVVGIGLAISPVAGAVAALIGGIALIVLGMKEFIETGEMTEESLAAILTGILLVSTAIGFLIGGPLGALVGFLVGVLIDSVFPLIIENWDKIKESAATAWEWVKEKTQAGVDKIKELGESLKTWVGDTWDSIRETLSNVWTWIKEHVINPIVDGFNNLTSKISDAWNSIKEFAGGFSFNLFKMKVPSFDVGTNYVQNDTLAMVHQGEAIVPKKFNQNEFFGTSTAEELNLLASINEQLIELNKKDTTISLDGQNIAETINNRIQDLNYRNGDRVFSVAR